MSSRYPAVQLGHVWTWTHVVTDITDLHPCSLHMHSEKQGSHGHRSNPWTADTFIGALKGVNLVGHTFVPERFKFTEDNKVGAFPHPVDITNAGNGVVFMLDFVPMSNQSRLVQLQLHNWHNPVRAEVVMEKLAGAQSLCASNGFVFVCTDDGIVVAKHTCKKKSHPSQVTEKTWPRRWAYEEGSHGYWYCEGTERKVKYTHSATENEICFCSEMHRCFSLE